MKVGIIAIIALDMSLYCHVALYVLFDFTGPLFPSYNTKETSQMISKPASTF